MGFVIYLIDNSPSSSGYDSGYWTGKTYIHRGETFAIRESKITDNTKKYTSRKRAENAAEKLKRKAVYVSEWVVEETE